MREMVPGWFQIEGLGFVLLGDGVLVSIIPFLIILGICGVYRGLTSQGVLQAFVFGFPLVRL